MTESPLPLPGKPGIKRDGTRTEGEYYVDGQWCRFNNLSKPRKMGGYSLISQLAAGLIYGCEVFTAAGIAYIYTGSSDKIEVQQATLGGVWGGGPVDRTPAGLASDANRIWVMNNIFDSAGGGTPRVLAHAASNLANIDSATTSKLYYGDMTATAALTDTGAPQLSGGVCVFHPYVFVYGSDGRVAWSNAGLPATWTVADTARITGAKIVYGAPVRGGAGSAPAGLFWSLDSLVRCTFVGGTALFNFDTITDESSIMSSRCVVELDGIYYWVGTDKFLMYNGVVREIPNALNNTWFFEGLNQAQRQKVWATKVSRWGEVWFMYPRGNATQCTHAAIYNTRLNTWYDTILPEGGRTDGFYAQTMRNPVWCGLMPDSSGTKYALWLHETYNSFDRTANGVTSAIESFFETPDLNFNMTGRIANVEISRLELDLNQTNDMTVQRIGQKYPRSTPVVTNELAFTDTAETIDDIRGQSRYMYLRFSSNVAGGFYEMGDTLAYLDGGDPRPGGG